MESKDSKAQLEVWDWKEKSYNQIKDMPLDKAVEFIMEQTKQTADELNRKLNENRKLKPS